jgi:hypothetical protein
LCRNYSVEVTKNNQLHPLFVTGFSDGECSFSIIFIKSPTSPNGYKIQLVYKIKLHTKDLALLESIKAHFGVGNISKSSNYVEYGVTSVKDLAVIVEHFEKYPLITKKLADYILFKQAFEIVSRKGHLTPKVFIKF